MPGSSGAGVSKAPLGPVIILHNGMGRRGPGPVGAGETPVPWRARCPPTRVESSREDPCPPSPEMMFQTPGEGVNK